MIITQDTVEHLIGLGGLVFGMYKLHLSNQKDNNARHQVIKDENDKRHEENITRLSDIEGTLKPITRWFNRHVIEGGNGD